MKVSLPYCSLFIAVAMTAMGCATFKSHNLPPAERLMEPGPGVGGPGPGVLAPIVPAAAMGGGLGAAMGGMAGGGGMVGCNIGPAGMPVGFMGPITVPTVQVLFDKPEGMQIRWDVGGVGMFDSEPLVVPGRYSFPQNGLYRLKITNIAGREGQEWYPTLEVAPATPRTEAYLAHNAVPVQFTEEDFAQIQSGNFVTKVIYLPDPEFQELALAGVETLVSTRLDPGVDPIVEADRRGSILAIVRVGNKDLEMPGGGAEVGGVLPVGYGVAGGAMACGPNGGVAGGPYLTLPGYVAGVTTPEWGMPYSGTPIGLPGPPHIPLGGPAGLQKHVMRNHTPTHIPDPTSTFKIHVRQQPGNSYPVPPSRMHIREQMIHPPLRYGQPYSDMHQLVR